MIYTLEKFTSIAFTCTSGLHVFLVQNWDGPWKCANGPCPIYLHAKIKNLVGHLEKRWAQETFISFLQQNEHNIWIAYG